MPETAENFTFPVEMDRVTNAIASGLNNEAKAVAFSHITEHFQSVSDISSAGNRIQGPEPAWAFTPQRIKDYADSFIYVEAIAKGRTPVGNQVALKRTELGTKLVRPLGGHLLLLSSEIEPDLYQVFGATQTRSVKGVRAVENRLKIMRMLAEEHIISMTELHNQQSLGREAGDNTDQMRKAKLLSKGDSRADVPHALWVVNTPGGYIEASDNMGKLRQDVIAVINQLWRQRPGQSFSSIDIARALPAAYNFAAQPSVLVQDVATTLSNMSAAASAAVKKHRLDIDEGLQFISVDRDQAALFKRILKIIDTAQQGTDDFIETGNQALREVLGNMRTVRYLMEKGYKHSVAHKIQQAHQLGNLILAVIAEAEAPISRRQIVDALAAQDVDAHFQTVTRYTKQLLQNGKIANDSHDNTSRFIVARDEDT